ncbi:PorV/PorQ family protein [candidate division WOR-3 bacterium]|uniref:PorV/PorQ family protein n=1 Tax=candidate division WOR-3 bacterium TaxID=2052148 RepID=A0A937XDP9_UNCW3|nr:PorV/PorQ family protein [candidate division WOR-3 bacterium]
MLPLTLALVLVGIDPNAGTTGFDFLRITPTAREAAMGGAGIGSASSPMGFWFSPAHVLTAESPRAHVGYLNYVAGIHTGSAAYSQPVGTDKGVGFGIVYLNSGTMKRTNERGEELGTFGVSYANLNLSGAMRLADDFAVGVALQGLYGSIDTFFGLGLAGNLGATYRLPVAGLTAGLAVKNVGYQIRAFRDSVDPMPIDFGLGLAYQPNPALNVALDVRKPVDNRINVRAGVEGWVADLLVVRAGYTTEGVDLRAGAGEDILAGVTTGLGFRWRGYQLDYCFIPMVELGVAHRLSLAFSL